VIETEPCQKSYIVIEKKIKIPMVTKNRDKITRLVKIKGQKILENFCEFCKMNSFINWRAVLHWLKLTRISDTPICLNLFKWRT
jgi:hypothetical protein